MEKTLIVFKPDAVQRGIVGEIITRFERVGLKIVGVKMLAPDTAHYYHHYENISKMATRRGQNTLDVTLKMLEAGPVIAMVLEGVESIAQVRKMTGTTEPKSAAPGTIRGDYAHMSFMHADNVEMGVSNIIHASGDKNEAEQEIAHWFSKDDIYNYKTTHDVYTQPGSK